jgi:hypothetical protein
LTAERDKHTVQELKSNEERNGERNMNGEQKKAMKPEKGITKKRARTRREDWEPAEIDQPKKKYRLGPDLDEL